jgi:hypothetical protein
MSLKRGVVLSLALSLVVVAAIVVAPHPSLQASPNNTLPTLLPTNVVEGRGAPGDFVSQNKGGYYGSESTPAPIGVLGNVAIVAPTTGPTSIPALGVRQAGLGNAQAWYGGVGTPVAKMSSAGALDVVTLSVGGTTFSGPIKYGVKDTILNGSTITHGMGTTPTVCQVEAVNGYFTATVSTIGTTTFVVNTASGANQGAVTWWCGK